MRSICILLLGAAISLFSCLTPVSADTPGLLGYHLMCLKTPSVCAKSGAKSIPYSAELLQTLSSVNKRVNSSIKPAAEAPGKDEWKVGATSGDCEDFALAKRAKLIKLGFPSAALRIATGMLADGQGHAVLVVHTSKGAYVLDVLTSKVKSLQSTTYRNWAEL